MKITEYDVLTGEYVTRDMTESELEQYEKDVKYRNDEKKSFENRQKSRESILAKLGLDKEEIEILLG